MNGIIVSDLHIGSQHFLYDDFERFIENVSENNELILNGDIIDNPYKNLTPPHQRTLTLLSISLTTKKLSGYEETMIMDMCQKGLRKSTLQVFIAWGIDY